MSKADKMLKELGFVETIHFVPSGYLVYEGTKGSLVFICDIGDIQISPTTYDYAQYSYKLYIAIYEKMKELGWLHEQI